MLSIKFIGMLEEEILAAVEEVLMHRKSG